jgi:hypothetical protein
MGDERTADTPDATRLDPSTFEAPRPAPLHERAKALHICPSCDSDLVFPVDWAPVDRSRWSVDLRCPNCDWNATGVFSQELVDAFDDALDRGTEALLDDLALLARANMEEQIERFVAALNGDRILPEDF